MFRGLPVGLLTSCLIKLQFYNWSKLIGHCRPLKLTRSDFRTSRHCSQNHPDRGLCLVKCILKHSGSSRSSKVSIEVEPAPLVIGHSQLQHLARMWNIVIFQIPTENLFRKLICIVNISWLPIHVYSAHALST